MKRFGHQLLPILSHTLQKKQKQWKYTHTQVHTQSHTKKALRVCTKSFRFIFHLVRFLCVCDYFIFWRRRMSNSSIDPAGVVLEERKCHHYFLFSVPDGRVVFVSSAVPSGVVPWLIWCPLRPVLFSHMTTTIQDMSIPPPPLQYSL